MPAPDDIVAHHDPKPGFNPWVRGAAPRETLEIVAYDPTWPALFEQLAADLRAALGPVALRIDHIGSSAVPGLAAKPVIDIDLTVADPTAEQRYVPGLAALGYDLVIREPHWHQHRCLRLEQPRVNLHVFGPDCPENIRHVLFRDWLRHHADDRLRYERAKQAAAIGAHDVMQYNLNKQAVIRDIYARVFAAAGLT